MLSFVSPNAPLDAPPPTTRRIASLDGLRAVSIALVILDHAVGAAHLSGAWNRLDMYGVPGVDVFFVISGFLITTLLLKEREKTGTISLRDFYVRRAYRILPAAYAAIIVFALVWHSRIKISDVLCSLFYVQNFHSDHSWSLGHMWSLSVEEQFYLLWPFLLNRFFRHRYKIAIAALIIAPLFRGVCAKFGYHEAQVFWFPSAMDALATGCLLALCREKVERWIAAADRWFIPILIGTIAIPQFSYPHGVEPVIMLSLQNFGIAFCVLHCIQKEYRILNWGPVVWIGVLSYSIYLWQQPFLQGQHPNVFERFPINLLCILPAAMASHYLIEKPFLRLRERRSMSREMTQAGA